MVVIGASQPHRFIKGIIRQQAKQLRQDETEQALFRIAISALLLVFFLVTDGLTNGAMRPGITVAMFAMSIYVIFAVIILWWMYRFHPNRVALRLIMMGIDLSAISLALYFSGENGAVLFGVYLWVVLGNGFRYGKLYLYVGTAMCLTGFITVFALSDYWAAHRTMGSGWIVGLIILPLFVNRLINRLHVLVEQANKASVAAETANRAKSEFFARMSHDLRTPMNGIMTTTDILRKSRGLSPENMELLNLIQDSAEVSLRQIDNVLDFAKLETGRLTLDPHPFVLRALIAASVRMVANTAREKKLRLLVTIAPETPNNLVGDLHHLRMVLMNLLANAVKFTESGYVAIKVEPVAQTPDAVTLRFSVHDTGIGIAAESLAHIWENFRQEHAQIARRYGGTGLGTTIAKQLVELMGGRISATSTKGKGSQFWFEVSLARHAAVADDAVARPAYRILLLSEDPRFVEAMRVAMAPSEATVFAVESAEDTYAAFARAARFGRSWNLVLIDDTYLRRHGGRRCEAVFMESGGALETSMYLLTEATYSDQELWTRGYSGALPRGVALPAIATLAVTTPPQEYTDEEDSRVVRVAPWIWRGVRKSVPRILMADDNYTNRKVITMVLETAGYAVDAVADGESALQKLVVGDYKAVVLDLHMPEMDGAEVLRQYISLFPGKTRPIVMLSSDVTEASKAELLRAGASVYLTKPVKSDVLVATLERLIEQYDVVPLTLSGEVRAAQESDHNPPRVLDMDVLADLEQVCKDTKELSDVIKLFETEADTMILRIDKAACENRCGRLLELAQALKGIAANVGAVQMVRVCDQILALSPQETDATTAVALTGELRDVYAISRNALYALVYPSESLRR
jgi:two-component system, sensor histidine kinase RpfC